MKTLQPISCCQSFKLVFKNCCKFSGRSRRSEIFYYYTTVNTIIITLQLIGTIIGFDNINSIDDKTEKKLIIITISFNIISFITFIPLLSLIVRRLHDIGKSAAHVIFYSFIHLLAFAINYIHLFVRIIGEIIILIYLCVDSQKMTNEYGPSPKYILNSNNLIPGNNYIPPNGPINNFPQPNIMTIPYNSNYPSQQQNTISPHNIPYSQPNPIPNQGNLYIQGNPIQNQGNPYPQQNPIPNKSISFPQNNDIQYQEPSNITQNLISPETMNNPQPCNFPPENNPVSQVNPLQYPTESSGYQSLDVPKP